MGVRLRANGKIMKERLLCISMNCILYPYGDTDGFGDNGVLFLGSIGVCMVGLIDDGLHLSAVVPEGTNLYGNGRGIGSGTASKRSYLRKADGSDSSVEKCEASMN
jgi:hypothetical protein